MINDDNDNNHDHGDGCDDYARFGGGDGHLYEIVNDGGDRWLLSIS